MEDFAKLIGIGVMAFLVVIVLGILGGIPVWLLWNWLMPKLFNLTTISLLEAIGLSILASCLFKSSSSSSKS